MKISSILVISLTFTVAHSQGYTQAFPAATCTCETDYDCINSTSCPDKCVKPDIYATIGTCTGTPTSTIPPIPSPTLTPTPAPTIGLRGECEFDCNIDADCEPGLECAEQHKNFLSDNGLHRRFAYCDPSSVPALNEVCYDPTKVYAPSASPSKAPTPEPTPAPSLRPTNYPTTKPSPEPTEYPTVKPTPVPSKYPTVKPSPEPTKYPTPKPSPEPTKYPTSKPSPEPTKYPTVKPTHEPSKAPTDPPSKYPTKAPTQKPTIGLLEECETDCDDDVDCQPGLKCADGRGNFLAMNRLDRRKAYCPGSPGAANAEVCYDPKKVNKLLGECESDCDRDTDCKAGLLCADEHKNELAANLLDRRKAYCNVNSVPNNVEVCYDPTKIVPPPPTPAPIDDVHPTPAPIDDVHPTPKPVAHPTPVVHPTPEPTEDPVVAPTEPPVYY